MRRRHGVVRFVRRELNLDDERGEQNDSEVRTNTIGNLIAIGIGLPLLLIGLILLVIF